MFFLFFSEMIIMQNVKNVNSVDDNVLEAVI